MTDFSALTFENNVKHATKLVKAAQADFGELSNGQRRDLLCDNTGWDRDMICRVVGALGDCL